MIALTLATVATAAAPSGPALAGCDCGSRDASAPCTGTSIRVRSPAPESWGKKPKVPPDASWCDGCDEAGRSTITFEFRCEGGDCACGRFASGGNYWVAPGASGAVEISSATPKARGHGDTRRNGMMKNPAVADAQGFDGRVLRPLYTPPLDLGDRTRAVAGDSIIKSVSFADTWTNHGNHPCSRGPGGAKDSHGPCVHSAAILTIVPEVPENAGATVLRPPFVGSAKDYEGGRKPLFSTTRDLDETMLPSLKRMLVVPSSEADLKRLTALTRGPKFDFHLGNPLYNQFITPFANVGPGYAQFAADRINHAALHLLLDYPVEEKRPLLYNVLQWGVDLWGTLHNGGFWLPRGGHGTGRLMPVVFAATLLHSDAMKKDLADLCPGGKRSGEDMSCTPVSFAEVGQLRWHDEAGMVLYGTWNDNRLRDASRVGLGTIECDEARYLRALETQGKKGPRWCEDPYGYIDGGDSPGHSYQGCCTSGVWTSAATVAFMIPEVAQSWIGDTMIYADRMMRFGQPDGRGGLQTMPDPKSRFPESHGRDIVDKQGKMKSSSDSLLAIAKQIWAAYRGCTPTCDGQPRKPAD